MFSLSNIKEECSSANPNTYYSDAGALILLFDCSDRRTFERVKEWDNKIEQVCKFMGKQNIVKILVGTKADLHFDVSIPNAQLFAKEKGFARLFFCSGKSGEGVGELVEEIAEILLDTQSNKSPLEDPIVVKNLLENLGDKELLATSLFSLGINSVEEAVFEMSSSCSSERFQTICFLFEHVLYSPTSSLFNLKKETRLIFSKNFSLSQKTSTKSSGTE